MQGALLTRLGRYRPLCMDGGVVPDLNCYAFLATKATRESDGFVQAPPLTLALVASWLRGLSPAVADGDVDARLGPEALEEANQVMRALGHSSSTPRR